MAINSGKHGKANTILITLDIIGFIILFIGAGLVRFAKDEIIAILGGFVIAAGVAVLSITRFISK